MNTMKTKLSINTFEEHKMQDKNYLKYLKQKNKIKAKYNPPLPVWQERKGFNYSKEDQKVYRAYLVKMADLLFEKHGPFQECMWDMESEKDLERVERRIKGRKTIAV